MQERTYRLSGRLKVSRADMTLFTQGRKRCTIRLGRVSATSDTILVTDGRREVMARIIGIDNDYEFGGLTEGHARGEGFSTLDELIRDLKHYYPNAQHGDAVSIIYLEPLDVAPNLFDVHP